VGCFLKSKLVVSEEMKCGDSLCCVPFESIQWSSILSFSLIVPSSSCLMTVQGEPKKLKTRRIRVQSLHKKWLLADDKDGDHGEREDQEARLGKKTWKHAKTLDVQSSLFNNKAIILGEENPAMLQNFFLNLLSKDGNTLKPHVDLSAFTHVTDALLQELADLHPGVESIKARGFSGISDVGLWALARTCSELRQIDFSYCNKITHIGLRSIALRCLHLDTIILDGCSNVNDLSVRVIAAGCPKLKHVSLQGCKKVADGGLLELAKCCRKLETLNLKHCSKISEFGDRALLEIGAKMSCLKQLNLSKCEYVEDAGIKAIARGCPHLVSLNCSGCKGLTGISLRSISRGCRELKILRLDECKEITNSGMLMIGEFLRELEVLSLRGVLNLNVHGVKYLSEVGQGLRILNLSGCVEVDDECLTILGNTLEQLEKAELNHLPKISKIGVRNLCQGCPKLVNLELNWCNRISKEFLHRLCQSLPFVLVATDRTALVPRPNALELIRETEEMRVHHAAAVVIQKMIRGVRVRGGVNKIRFWALRRFVVPKVQAITRGYLTRKRLRLEQETRDKTQASLLLQRHFRGHQGRKRARHLRKLRAIQKDLVMASVIIQSGFRGWQGRRIVANRKRILAIEAMQASEERGRQEAMTLRIQRKWRARKGYLEYVVLLNAKFEREKQLVAEKTAALKLQSRWRSRAAFQELLLRKAEKAQRELEWRSAIQMQCVARGFKGRLQATAARMRRQWKLENNASVKMQKAWRGCKARHLAAVMQSFARLVAKENAAALTMQQFWRRIQAQQVTQFMRIVLADKKRRNGAALQIQSLFRGHKGRETFEVVQALQERSEVISPLRAREVALEEERCHLSEEIQRKIEARDKLEGELHVLHIELKEVMKHSGKFYDSANITGTLQRFETSFLAQELRAKSEVMKAKLKKMKADSLENMKKELRNLEKEIRFVKKEISPLLISIEEEIRKSRANRMRAKLQREREAAAKIQRTFLGYRVRKAVALNGRFWEEFYDEETGEMFYQNLRTSETSFEQPWSMNVILSEAKRLQERAEGRFAKTAVEAQSFQPWAEFFDEKTGLPFYYNYFTEEYRWEIPRDLEMFRQQSSHDPGELQFLSNEDSFALRETAQGWVELRTHQDEVYYFNNVTGESQWERPLSFDKHWMEEQEYCMNALTTRSRRSREINSGWIEMQDEQSGVTFYYHSPTQVAQWEKPKDFDQNWLQDNKEQLSARSVRSNRFDGVGSPWQELIDPETNFSYFYNSETGEVRWSLSPDELHAEY